MNKKFAWILAVGLILGVTGFAQDAGQTSTTETTRVKIKKKKHKKESSATTTTTTTTKPQ